MCMSLDGFWHDCMYVTYVNVNVGLVFRISFITCFWHKFVVKSQSS